MQLAALKSALFGASVAIGFWGAATPPSQAGSTTTTLDSTPNPSVVGETVTFTAGVTAPWTDGAPTGTVSFTEGSTQLGDGTLTTLVSRLRLGTGAAHTCALTSTLSPRCWGFNGSGALGDGTTTERHTPGNVSTLSSGVAAIHVGLYHTCALTSSGGAKCWGDNENGRLGDGTTINRSTPVNVVGLSSGVDSIDAGLFHTCAIATGGAKCWGNNGRGKLGDGTTVDRLTPVDVVGLSSGVAAISAGGTHTCALTSAGGLKCWGHGGQGQLGIGPAGDRFTPTDVVGLTSGAAAITTGTRHTCALTSAGGAKCWGYNLNGQIGDGANGANQDRDRPVDVSGLSSGVAAIVAGDYHTCALTSAGGAKCWGDNSLGQLGDGTTTGRNVPTDVTGLTSGVIAITAGSQHTCALTVANGMQCWGDNSRGQLGDGTTVRRLTPTNVTGFGGVAEASSYAFLRESALSTGRHGISATYNGDAGHDSSVSSTLTHIVTATAPTTTTLSAADSTMRVGQRATFTATVSSTYAGTPTGTVTFKVGSQTLGSAPLDAGAASFATTSLEVGSNAVTAAYSGDDDFTSSTSSAVRVDVLKGDTETSLKIDPRTVLPGERAMFTATVVVKPPARVPAEGNVEFLEGSRSLGIQGITRGTASLGVTALTTGTHAITAKFLNSDLLRTSTSAAKTLIVDPRVGSESRANSSTAGSQQQPAIAPFANGDFLIAWASNRADGSGFGVNGQRFTTAGKRVGGEFRANTTTRNDQWQPSVAADDSGRFVVTWASDGQDGSGFGIYAQRYTAAGARDGREVRINRTTASEQVQPKAAAFPDGGFVITWASQGKGSASFDVYAQRFSRGGQKDGPEIVVNTTTVGMQSTPAVAVLDDGGFVVVWAEERRGAGFGIRGQRFLASGDPAGDEFMVGTTTTSRQSAPAVASLGADGFVVTWESEAADGSGLGIYAQRFKPNGRPDGKLTRVNSTTSGDQSQPAVAAFPEGGFIITWTSGDGLYAQRFTAAGAPTDVEFPINRNDRNQQQPCVAAFTEGRFVIAWTSFGQDGSLEGIFFQRFQVLSNGRVVAR